MFKEFDIIVVGAGHAGCEAAYCCANLKENTLLITQNLSAIAQLSCNPAMGGVAKGQIVREIDALGGYSGINTDKNTMQFRMLNSSKGPAMWSPRAQEDDITFPLSWREKLENTDNLSLWQDEVVGVILENEKVCGVKTKLNLEIRAKAVVLTNGTFLSGRIHVGETNFVGGRLGETSAIGLTENLVSYGFVAEKLKTGTPMRVDGRTIDFNKLKEQKGDENPSQFSFLPQKKNKNIQRSCFLAYTNEQVHDILRTGFKYSPMFQGRIQGKGPRYCPSIEDKIERFSGKTRHQLFVEPESNYTNLYYINGFSSSLPLSVQYEALQHIVGFEHSVIERPGYAIEYDYFPPTQLQDTLETKLIKNLFFAGQINGTTGYEEAACQGLIAGINAHLKIKEKEPLVLKRSEAYIGVLIDELITKGVDEPYRMFTSRAEYRILLRQDNADARLTGLSHAAGLASDERMRRVEEKLAETERLRSFVSKFSIKPDLINNALESIGTTPLSQGCKLIELLNRPQITIENIAPHIDSFKNIIESIDQKRDEIIEAAEVLMKYKGYIEREKIIADKIQRLESIKIKGRFDYELLQSLSTEARQKLKKIDPGTLAQASRIPGISPSDINVLLVLLGR